MHAPNERKVIPLNLEGRRKIAEGWGWSNPSEEVLALAGKCLQAMGLRSGEVLVEWNIIDAATRDRLLRNKPADVQTLHYFAEHEPSRVLQYVEQILALKNGHAYYERLSILGTHSSMEEATVIRACKANDAVLMLAEGSQPVLVFSRWDSMLAYTMMGAAARMTDPIFIANKGMPLFAVGARDDISAILKRYENDQESGGASENAARAWNVKVVDKDTPAHEKDLARILDHALTIGASDVAFKPLRDGTLEVRLRKWGWMVEPFKPQAGANADGKITKTIFSAENASKAINLLLSKSFASDYTQMREPKDGQINYKSSAHDAFMRLSFIPLNHLGEYKPLVSVSARLFNRAEVSIRLKDLNIPDDVALHIREAMKMPQGLVLLSGPTNSGKSSTIAGAIGEHNDIYGDSLKRASVEDPVERHLPGIVQWNVPMHVDEDKRFSTVLKGIHRHDLDLLWVGEVRDPYSAEFCVNFAVTGHLALSSIHARDSIGAYDNLSLKVKEEVRPQVIEAMSLSVGQRLIKAVCPHCSEQNLPPNDDEKRMFELNLRMTGATESMPRTVTRVTNPEGCDQCDNGYAGELPILELLPFTREVKDAALSRLFGDEPRKQREIMAKARTITLLESGLRLMAEGKTDMSSILFF